MELKSISLSRDCSQLSGNRLQLSAEKACVEMLWDVLHPRGSQWGGWDMHGVGREGRGIRPVRGDSVCGFAAR